MIQIECELCSNMFDERKTKQLDDMVCCDECFNSEINDRNMG